MYTYVYSCTRTEVRYESTRALQGLHKRVHVQYNVVRIAEVGKYGSTKVPSKVLSKVLFSKVLSYFRTKVFYLRTKVLSYFRTSVRVLPEVLPYILPEVCMIAL